MAADKDVTWLYCRCGHQGAVGRLQGDKEALLARSRCSVCGAKGAVDLRHGVIAGEQSRDT